MDVGRKDGVRPLVGVLREKTPVYVVLTSGSSDVGSRVEDDFYVKTVAVVLLVEEVERTWSDLRRSRYCSEDD